MSLGAGLSTKTVVVCTVSILCVLGLVVLVRTFAWGIPARGPHVPTGPSELAEVRRADPLALDESPRTLVPRSTRVTEPAPPLPAPIAIQREYPPKDPIAYMAENIRHDIEKLRELKLAGTAERIVSRSTYMREDLLGRSYLDPVPADVMKNLKTFATFTGPNGARTYVFTPEEYPLYTEVKGRVMLGEPYEKVVSDEFVEQVVAYAEETLAWIGPRPK